VQGWVDSFGGGLPTVTIAGTTGWRAGGVSGEDGADAFESLNTLIQHDYHDARQSAIDAGIDPATIKLLFIDTLDNFIYSVSPSQFILRRSKSRPLLYQYNINLQAIDTDPDAVSADSPFSGDFSTGLTALDNALTSLDGYLNSINGLITTAEDEVESVVAPVADAVSEFADMSYDVLSSVQSVIATGESAIGSVAGTLIGIAGDVALTGMNVFRTFAAVAGIGDFEQSQLSMVASTYCELYCIFNNSLKAAETYEDYSDVFGASNCSSTTGGEPASIYAGSNVFDLLQAAASPVTITSAAAESLSTLAGYDPVLAALSIPEISRNLSIITQGISLNV
jgi:hypothetical protein